MVAMIQLCEARYDSEYKIWLKFNTGESALVDLADIPVRFKAASSLADPEEFRKFYLDDWPTLVWPCGFDLAPESLYERATGKRSSWATPDHPYPVATAAGPSGVAKSQPSLTSRPTAIDMDKQGIHDI